MHFAFLFAISGLLLSVCNPKALALREYVYKINGKKVPRNVYDSAMLVKQAAEQLKKQRPDLAASSLRRALVYDPDSSVANSLMAVLLTRDGKVSEARKHFELAVKSQDCSPLAFLGLASFRLSQGDLEGAIASYKSYLGRIDPSGPGSDSIQANLKMLEKELETRKQVNGQAGTSKKSDYYDEMSEKTRMRWSNYRLPLRVYIRPSTGVDGYTDMHDAMLRKGFRDWELASNRLLKFVFVNTKEDSDIDCVWTGDPSRVGHGSEYGFTESKALSGALQHASITLLTKNNDQYLPMTDNTIAITCRHEVGHALGIEGHSCDPADVMYFCVSMVDQDLPISQRDKQTLKKVYGKDLPLSTVILDFLYSRGNFARFFPIMLIVFLLLLLLVKASKKKTKKKKR